MDVGVAASPARERVWLHGDLHARNVLVRRGRLAAVLDWGDITAGDPSTDLAAVWWLFDLTEHHEFWKGYGLAPTATRRRNSAVNCYAVSWHGSVPSKTVREYVP